MEFHQCRILTIVWLIVILQGGNSLSVVAPSVHNIIFSVGSIVYVMKYCTWIELHIAAYKKEVVEE